MSRKRLQNSTFGPDDYNQPTEPIARLASAQIPPAPRLETSFWPEDTPAPSLYENRRVRRYPVRPAVRRAAPRSSVRRRKRRRSPLPGLVKWVAVLVQLVLLGRVVCMWLGIAAIKPWLGLLFAASDLLVWPARWLATYVHLSLLTGTQLLVYLEFLLAMLVYALGSWLLLSVLAKFV
jgi:hypothetical protein